MAISSIELWVVGLYFLAMLGVGVYAGRQVKGAEDYAVAGRRLGFPVLSGTLTGSAIGAAATFGKAGKAYEVGFIVLFASLAYMLGYIVFAYIAPRLRAANIDTIPDALERRYGKAMRVVAATVMMISVVTTFGAQLIAFGLTASTVLSETGISYEQAVVGAALIVVLYTLVGGLLAVAYTDLIQVAIMLVAIAFILPVCLALDLGDQYTLSAVLESPQSDFMAGLKWSYLLAFIPTYLAFVLIDPSIWQRCAAARSADHLRPAMFVTAGIYALWSLVVVVLGVIAYNVLPELSNGDVAIPTLVMAHMPPLVKGLCLAAIMAIMMSTADSVLLIAGTTFSGDIVKVLKPEISDANQLKVARSVIFLVGILGAVFAFGRSNIFEVMMLSLAIFVSGLFVPVMAALFWKKASALAGISAAVTGAFTELAVFGLKSAGLLSIEIEPILIAITVSFITMWLVGSLGYNTDTATLPLLSRSSTAKGSKTKNARTTTSAVT